MKHSVPQDIFTLQEAAAFLRLSDRTVWQLAADGQIPGRKVGAQWRFTRQQLLAFLEGNATPATQG